MGVYVSGQDVWKNSENGGRGKKLKKIPQNWKTWVPRLKAFLKA